MTNKNLLLDKTSQAFAKPELDIKNSDVICTHSSTTGTLDEEQIFYIQSRGLSYEESVNMLIEAFYQDIKSKMEAS
jgi:Fe-S cluster assembly protein SufD